MLKVTAFDSDDNLSLQVFRAFLTIWGSEIHFGIETEWCQETNVAMLIQRWHRKACQDTRELDLWCKDGGVLGNQVSQGRAGLGLPSSLRQNHSALHQLLLATQTAFEVSNTNTNTTWLSLKNYGQHANATQGM